MNGRQLTRKQSQLVAEIKEIMKTLSIDTEQVISETKPREVTVALEVMRNEVIKGRIVNWYTLLDEVLGMIISAYFFGAKSDTIHLWRTKKYKIFNYYVLEKLSLMEKFALVKGIKKVPKQIAKHMEYFNSLRNAVAHAYFPENLRSFKTMYKGEDIFSLRGVTLLRDDFYETVEYFKRAWPAVRPHIKGEA